MKLYPHLQIVPDWAPAMFDGRVPYVKQIFYDGDAVDRFPHTRTIARLWIGGDGEEEKFVRDGADGGARYFAKLHDWYEALRGTAYAFEGPNEQNVKTPEACQVFGEFTWAWVMRMRAHGLPTISGNVANGNLDINDPAIMLASRKLFIGTFWGMHGYGLPAMDSEAPWFTLRHRLLTSTRKAMGLSTPPVFYGEVGLGWQEGWRNLCNWEEYKRQLLWWDAEMQKDKRAWGGFLYTSGPWGPLWESFNVGESEWRDLLGL